MSNEINGFLKGTSLWEVSSVSTDHLQKKKLELTKYDSKAAAQTMYVRECLTHEHGVFIRINLFARVVSQANHNYEKIAEGMACVLCWKISKVYEEEDDWKLEGKLRNADPKKQREVGFKK